MMSAVVRRAFGGSVVSGCSSVVVMVDTHCC